MDGDDYWIDKHRLERQINFLDVNPDYSMCGGNTFVIRGEKKQKLLPAYIKTTYGFDDYIRSNCPFVHTSSLLYRNEVFASGVPDIFRYSVGTIMECAYRGEDARFALHMQKGKLKIFHDVFSVYRIHEKGIWQGASELKKNIESTITSYAFGTEILPEFQDVYFRRFIHQLKTLQIKLKQCIEGSRPFPTEQEIDMYSELLKLAAREKINTKPGGSHSISIKRRMAEKLYKILESQLYP